MAKMGSSQGSSNSGSTRGSEDDSRLRAPAEAPYRQEKYVEGLEDQIAELQVALRLAREQVRRSGAGGSSSAVEAEELYRRARTEVVAEAGAGYGRVSLEALYLLPTEFTNAYQRLFLAALKESPGRGGGDPNPLVRKAPKLINKGDGATLDRDPDRGGGKARAGGRRHRDHWIVSDESAFRLKGRVDAELRVLAQTALDGLKSGDGSSRAAGSLSRLIRSDANDGAKETSGNGVTPTVCKECSKFLKTMWSFCPWCGSSSG